MAIMNELERRRILGFDNLARYLIGQGAEIEIDNPLRFRHPYALLSRCRGRIPIEQQIATMYESHGGIASFFTGCDSEREVGHVFLETGVTKEGNYEILEVKFARPIHTESGLAIPRSRVRIHAEDSELTDGLQVQRQDHVKGRFFWKKADLQGILPNHLFRTSEVRYDRFIYDAVRATDS